MRWFPSKSSSRTCFHNSTWSLQANAIEWSFLDLIERSKVNFLGKLRNQRPVPAQTGKREDVRGQNSLCFVGEIVTILFWEHFLENSAGLVGAYVGDRLVVVHQKVATFLF